MYKSDPPNVNSEDNDVTADFPSIAKQWEMLQMRGLTMVLFSACRLDPWGWTPEIWAEEIFILYKALGCVVRLYQQNHLRHL